jgi:hypothetical protein
VDSLMHSFWCGSKDGKRRTCWVAWEYMTMPKYMGRQASRYGVI